VADGFAALQAYIARVRSLEHFAREAAPACAEELKDELDAQIARGEDPNGAKWPLRKDTGERTLKDAAKALAVVAVGRTVFFRLRGPEARHHKGFARGGVIRRVLPVAGLPRGYALAIKRGLERRFEQTMGTR
jgi:hypothetical protein